MNPGRGWNEAGLSEDPAVELLRALGYTYVDSETLEAERESLKQVVLVERLAKALKRINPWLSDDNIHKAVRDVTNVQAASLIEANEKLFTTLTYGMSVEQDRGDGRRSHTLRVFDFDEPTNNEFVVTRQFRVRGAKKHIIPDVVLLVNGLPLVIIECKSPTIGEKWFHEAVEQFVRYQESSPKFRGLGAPKLFETVQAVIATCGQRAYYGTVETPQRFFGEWKRPYPMSVEDIESELGRKPNPQDVLFVGMLTPERLLDIVRNFIVFERDPATGRTIKKVCRYQQYGAVNKALTRIHAAKKPTERGGVVWHTQGSGKSLTMLWLAMKLRRDPKLENPTLVIVTDRRDLDEQITKTFVACGFPNPERAESVRDMRALLSSGGGRTVMTTVQKFMDLAEPGPSGKRQARTRHPKLTDDDNVFVLTDEAHRSQYGTLSANLRQALPNACLLGFTGTPIDKKDRSTLQTFGPYIDTYTIEQAVADKATVPIFYEGRLPELRIIGNTLDQIFDRMFADRSDEERDAIKKKYATEQAVAEAPRRIEAICLDIIEHYTKYIQPNGFKAQIVTVSREAAVTYKETLDRLNAPQSAVMISASNKDEERLARHHRSTEERKAVIERFLKPDDPLSILVVCDMLITGFDAPIEQVMYLDSPLKEHTLLQAIARTNRTYEGKTYGLVVDYWGVSNALQEALQVFAPSDVKGALTPKDDELPRLQTRHAAAMRFFARLRDKDDLEKCIAVLEPEDVRAEFNTAFRRFSKSLDMMLPDPRALPYVDDMRWLGKIRGAAAAKFRDSTLDVSDCGQKVRELIDEAVVAEGIQILVKQVSLFSNEFDEKLDKLKSVEAKASEMEHAIKHEIHVKLEENPAFYRSLRERLEHIIEDRKARRIDEAEQLKLFEVLINELKGEAQAAEDLGLSETGYAIYGLIAERQNLLKVSDSVTKPGYNEATKELAEIIDEVIEPHIHIVDWAHKEDVQREMRRLIKRQLKAAKMPPADVERLAASIIDLAKARRGA